jgi:hypothetical protein
MGTAKGRLYYRLYTALVKTCHVLRILFPSLLFMRLPSDTTQPFFFSTKKKARRWFEAEDGNDMRPE